MAEEESEHHGKERKCKKDRDGGFEGEWRALSAKQKGADKGMNSVEKFSVLLQKASVSW